MAGLGLTLAGRVTAQTFTTLYSFRATIPYTNDVGGVFYTNSDGATPVGGLTLSGDTLYGTTPFGGTSGAGAVFEVKTDGTGFTNLYSFTAASDYYPSSPNSDGASPWAGLVLSNNTLYGTANRGGSSGWGTVFAVNTDGTSFMTLYSFTALDYLNGNSANSDGAYPIGGLILSGNKLYGTGQNGGSSHNGTVFDVNTDGSGFKTLHSFTGYPSEGAIPYAGLILSGSTLYGTTGVGGGSLAAGQGGGTVFRVNTNGTSFRKLHNFSGGSDGAYPYAGLILSGNTLYGTTCDCGSSGYGTVFRVNTDGTGVTTLYIVTAFSGPTQTNSDGAFPQAGLILSGNTLYGTTEQGGRSGRGTVFGVTLPAPPQVAVIPSGVN